MLRIEAKRRRELTVGHGGIGQQGRQHIAQFGSLLEQNSYLSLANPKGSSDILNAKVMSTRAVQLKVENKSKYNTEINQVI